MNHSLFKKNRYIYILCSISRSINVFYSLFNEAFNLKTRQENLWKNTTICKSFRRGHRCLGGVVHSGTSRQTFLRRLALPTVLWTQSEHIYDILLRSCAPYRLTSDLKGIIDVFGDKCLWKFWKHCWNDDVTPAIIWDFCYLHNRVLQLMWLPRIQLCSTVVSVRDFIEWRSQVGANRFCGFSKSADRARRCQRREDVLLS